MGWTVITHPEVDEWQAALDNDTLNQVVAAVRQLRDDGAYLNFRQASSGTADQHSAGPLSTP